MAKARMVTRTVNATLATVLCLNTETAEPFNQTVILGGTYKDNKSILKDAKKIIDNDEVTAVKIVNVEIEEKLYGMTEIDFLKSAKELPPRTKKA